ncbi:Nse1 non-SMC component of SMC5-6 complex-domain-containing protein [Dendryphion nanum]|uniref:Non-structural maintenance of chromosomes element 1 homolog n=1 Tax=Dendryphion nanum TaxID=256645 RepID=A0A9P9EK02_9PLEO|nr:Nse1 non-SMC component of SMC5-6 complex-domain-containing protein [Dendryphion nanum]
MSREEIRAETPDDAGGYNNAHRAFLQAFLSKSIMSLPEIKPVLAAVLTAQDPNRPVLEGDITVPDVTSFIQTVNARITSLDYEIRSTRSQTSKSTIYALINSTSDPLTHLATTFNIEEIGFIKRVLDHMFETNNTRNREIIALKDLDANRIAKPARSNNRQSQINGDAEEGTQAEASLKGVTLTEGERVLQILVSQNFLEKSRAGYYTLAPRALMELRFYLKETYNEPADPEDPDSEAVIRIRDCEACREIVTVGLRCRNKECGIRFHDQCANQWFRSQRASEDKCPGCKREWGSDCFVGERAATMAGRPGGSRASGGRIAVFEDGEEDEEDEDEEE